MCFAAAVSAMASISVEARGSSSQPPAAQAESPLTQETPLISMAPISEIRDAAVRLPLAAVLGTALALRPRRRSQARRSVLVVQTQIMLAVVGAVIMLVVGNSLSRAFGIVGAAGLVRYRSTIDDPKEAVVMLCALGAGLASGVGLYILAPFATIFMAGLLWLVESFEPSARKFFELTIITDDVARFRPKVEGVLHGLQLDYELLTQADGSVSYSVSAPIDVRTRDVSDTLRLLCTDERMSIEWVEKRGRK
jgi:uncharacterized membrane protein YhiD involved in acid resistance